ncbi:MAG: hypothetical protein IJW83_03655 [Clostridia bacterium]|nr:hypothetical protein [Clostridia bacterium]
MNFNDSSYFSDKRCFFAAANGYSGFRSYFHEFFRPDDYTRIFVLKGGPGTGKSRLLRSVGTVFEDSGCHVDWIFCSSDPASLDGVILMEGGRRVALLDGTAPHERDAVVPGAVDTLINLGDGWDEEALILRRPDILTLTKVKQAEYKKAYEYLHLCSDYDEKIKAEAVRSIGEAQLHACIETLLSGKKANENATPIRRPIGAFCRFGYITLPTYEHIAQTVLYPVGHAALRSVFVHELSREAAKRGIAHLRSPSPFTDDATDAVFFTDDHVAVVAYPPVDEAGAIPVELPSSRTPFPDSAVTVCEEVQRELLLKAERSLSCASEAHASLERIYTAAMNFENNDRLIDTLIHRIKGILYEGYRK